MCPRQRSTTCDRVFAFGFIILYNLSTSRIKDHGCSLGMKPLDINRCTVMDWMEKPVCATFQDFVPSNHHSPTRSHPTCQRRLPGRRPWRASSLSTQHHPQILEVSRYEDEDALCASFLHLTAPDIMCSLRISFQHLLRLEAETFHQATDSFSALKSFSISKKFTFRW